MSKYRLTVLLAALTVCFALAACVQDTPPADTADITETTAPVGGSVTAAPTDMPDESHTDPSEPTNGPTDTPTEPVEETTEAPTDGENEAASETDTATGGAETPTEPTTDGEAETPTEPATETPTEAPTEPSTESPTEAPDEPARPPEGYRVGETCYDATLPLYDGSTYIVSEGRGRVTVLNFWGSWCGPCKNELPHFDRLATEMAGQVNVVTIHSDYGISAGESYLRDNFPDTAMVLAYDVGDVYYDLVARNTVWPITVILDAEGVVRFRCEGALTYSQLKNMVSNALP